MRSMLQSLASAGTTAAAMLLAFGAAVWLKEAAGLNDSIVVLTVALTVTLARTQRDAALRRRLLGLAMLPLAAIAANEVGRLLFEHPDIGDTLFALGVSAAIWIRRFGPLATAAGSLATLPFVAVLVSPVPPGSGGSRVLWAAPAALIASLAIAVFQLPAIQAGLIQPRPAAPSAARTSGLRLVASDRMACQMALALGSAFWVGRLAYGDHWTWTVLTAFIVCSGNQGRGDVVYKSVLRIAGAAVGTVAATFLAGAFPPGDHWSVVVILAVLAVASWLRGYSYAYWAGCVTAVLSLLYGYFGQTGTHLLHTRLEAIAVGALLGVAASWFVLPVRSTDVARRRTADALAALTDVLSAVRRRDADQLASVRTRFDHSLARLDDIAGPFEAHRALSRRLCLPAPRPADAIDALRSCAEPVYTLTQQAAVYGDGFAERAEAVAGNILAVRRAIGRRPGPGRRPLDVVPAQEAFQGQNTAQEHAALGEIDAALERLTQLYGASPQPGT